MSIFNVDLICDLWTPKYYTMGFNSAMNYNGSQTGPLLRQYGSLDTWKNVNKSKPRIVAPSQLGLKNGVNGLSGVCTLRKVHKA